MKKILLMITAGLLMPLMAQATTFDNPVFTECSDWHNGCGIAGIDGVDGYTPILGVDYFNGVDGTDGADGIDFNSYGYELAYYATLEAIKEASEIANQAIAGASALAAIDFGTTKEGVTEFGAGIGVSDSYIGRDYAAAIGFKRGLSDTTAAIIKGWRSSDSYTVGVAVTYTF